MTRQISDSYLDAFVSVFTLSTRSLTHTSSEPQSFVKGIWNNNRAGCSFILLFSLNIYIYYIFTALYEL